MCSSQVLQLWALTSFMGQLNTQTVLWSGMSRGAGPPTARVPQCHILTLPCDAKQKLNWNLISPNSHYAGLQTLRIKPQQAPEQHRSRRRCWGRLSAASLHSLLNSSLGLAPQPPAPQAKS